MKFFIFCLMLNLQAMDSIYSLIQDMKEKDIQEKEFYAAFIKEKIADSQKKDPLSHTESAEKFISKMLTMDNIRVQRFLYAGSLNYGEDVVVKALAKIIINFKGPVGEIKNDFLRNLYGRQLSSVSEVEDEIALILERLAIKGENTLMPNIDSTARNLVVQKRFKRKFVIMPKVGKF